MPWPTKTEATAKNVDLKPRPEGGSDKIDMWKKEQTPKKVSSIVLPGVTHRSKHLERETC